MELELDYEQFSERYGKRKMIDDWDAVDTASNHLWTMVDGEGASVIYLNGYHYVNRLAYVITEKPWLDGEDIFVLDTYK